MSVAGKIAFGVVCCCGFALAALLFLYAVNPWIDHKAIPVFGSRPADTALFGAAGLICAFVTTRLSLTPWVKSPARIRFAFRKVSHQLPGRRTRKASAQLCKLSLGITGSSYGENLDGQRG